MPCGIPDLWHMAKETPTPRSDTTSSLSHTKEEEEEEESPSKERIFPYENIPKNSWY